MADDTTVQYTDHSWINDGGAVVSVTTAPVGVPCPHPPGRCRECATPTPAREPRPLEHMSTPALCFALGSCTRTPTERDYARILMLCDELSVRGELEPMVATLDDDLRAALGLVVATARARFRYGSGQHRRPTLDEPPAIG